MNKQIYILKIKWIDGGGFNEEFNSSQELFDRLAEIEENKNVISNIRYL